MEILTLTIFVSVTLVMAAAIFFAWNLRHRSHEHADRLALLPLSDDADGADAGANAGPVGSLSPTLQQRAERPQEQQ